MPTSPAVFPDEEVQKNISKVDDAEIGENLDFERHWSKVQNVAWIVFAAFLLGGLLGVFGKGPLARATVGTSQDPFYTQYDRFARYMTTSNLRFVITPSARIKNGTAQVFMSEDLVKTLRTEQINPHPLWGSFHRRRHSHRPVSSRKMVQGSHGHGSISASGRFDCGARPGSDIDRQVKLAVLERNGGYSIIKKDEQG